MSITVKPLDAALGAEIIGLDVRDISPASATALHEAFLKHHLLVIRDQPITDEEGDPRPRVPPGELDDIDDHEDVLRGDIPPRPIRREPTELTRLH